MQNPLLFTCFALFSFSLRKAFLKVELVNSSERHFLRLFFNDFLVMLLVKGANKLALTKWQNLNSTCLAQLTDFKYLLDGQSQPLQCSYLWVDKLV